MPALPSLRARTADGLAIAGDYLLFVVDQDGVPSAGTHLWLHRP